MKHRAFTLWEVLVGLAIIVVLAAILFPMFVTPHSARLSVRRRNCASNLQILGLAIRVYTSDSDNRFLPSGTKYDAWVQTLSPYLSNSSILTCPSSNHKRQGATDYFYNVRLASVERTRIVSPKSVILSGDGDELGWPSAYLTALPKSWRTDENSPAWRHLDGANYLFVDGHVKAYSAKRIFGARDAATPTFEVK